MSEYTTEGPVFGDERDIEPPRGDDTRNVFQKCDFVGWDNSDPPQLWAWAGEYGDESSEPLFRLPADWLRTEWEQLKQDIERLRTSISEPRMKLHAEIQRLSEENEGLRRLASVRERLVQKKNIEKLRSALQTIRDLCDSMPCGYDTDLDPEDPSPSDANAHTTGLIVRACEEAMRDV